MTHIKKTIPDTVDPLQFAYRQNRSTNKAVNNAIHTEGTYVRMPLIDDSSSFNTVIPQILTDKLLTLGLSPPPLQLGAELSHRPTPVSQSP